MEQRVLSRLRKDFQVGSEDWSDVTFTGQRVRWKQNAEGWPYIEVSQERAVDELEEISLEKNVNDDLKCTPSMHTRYRSLLGQINWLQSRTQFTSCYKFSRCEGNEQVGEATEIPIGDTAILAISWTPENPGISRCVVSQQRGWIVTTRHGNLSRRTARAVREEWYNTRKLSGVRKPKN